MPNDVIEEPSDISVKDGHVIIHCSSGVTYTFTPDAAVITSDRLLQAGLQAKRQQTDSGTGGEPRLR